MATVYSPPDIEYPTSDGRPMAETDHHRDLMVEGIETIKLACGSDPSFYVSGSILVFYERGNRRKHVAPDFFAVRGVHNHPRDHYLIWLEGKAPEVAIEYTSKTTRKEDEKTKFVLYRDRLRVQEYFLFDPFGDYLKPPFQGYRLKGNRYVKIRPMAGRLPSEVLGLHLERHGDRLRFYDPATGRWLPTPDEARQQAEVARQQAEAAHLRAEAEQMRAEAALQQAEAEKQRAEAENERLRIQLAELQRRSPQP
jgi:hypothetical protein